MSAPENQAAWLLGVGKAIEIGPAPLPTPGNGELLIKVMAVAVQPAGYKIQRQL
jgi:NADPH:quinone reductase-like Zn-dependent oxidoreductase